MYKYVFFLICQSQLLDWFFPKCYKKIYQNSPYFSLFNIKEDKNSSFDIEEGQNSPGSSLFDIGEDKNSLFDIEEDKKSWTITVQIVIEQSFALEAALSANSLDKTLNFMLNTLPRTVAPLGAIKKK